MNSHELDAERRKQRSLQRLGTDHPQCIACGEDDWRCLELHHLAGRAYDEGTVILCRNCHRKQSDPSDNADAPTDPPNLERVGRFLLGLAALFLMLAAKLKAFGEELLRDARSCSRPYGWQEATGGAT